MELPHDEFRIALVLHPNVWAAHSRRQIESWLAEALRSGLLLIPPEEGWRAAVVAADHVLSDHGSVGVYAAAVGRPVLLEPGGRGSVDPHSGLGRLYEAAQPLDVHAPLRPQLHLAEKLRERTEEVARTWVSSAPGEALDLIRAEAYRLMGARPPGMRTPFLAVPAPQTPGTAPSSLWTTVDPLPDASVAPDAPVPSNPPDPPASSSVPTAPPLVVRRIPAAVTPGGVDDAVPACSDDELDHRGLPRLAQPAPAAGLPRPHRHHAVHRRVPLSARVHP